MTAPDVAALAAALDSPPYVIDDFEAEAQRIIAALAAQGARITFDPEDWTPTGQAAPFPHMDVTDEEAEAFLAAIADPPSCNDRVRAALEGLRAEVDALPGMAIASSTDSQRLQAWVNRPALRAIIDARLAALDE